MTTRAHVTTPLRPLLFAVGLALLATPALAQVDLTGEWRGMPQVSEDQPHRVPGPELGDYTGMPVNEAARLKARTWDASILSQPERQTQPHPGMYSTRGGGGPNLRIEKIVDYVTGAVIAYKFNGFYGRADRTIWMDGRPHPSPFAEHTWEGFSTGEWAGSALKVTTTHFKAGVLLRNGTPASPYARMTEFWTRHHEHLGVFTWVDDPMYLEEPMVRTTDWLWNPQQNLGLPNPLDVVDELGDRPLGWVPSYPMGTLHEDFAKRHNLPFEATLGGKESLYPEFMQKIKEMQARERR